MRLQGIYLRALKPVISVASRLSGVLVGLPMCDAIEVALAGVTARQADRIVAALSSTRTAPVNFRPGWASQPQLSAYVNGSLHITTENTGTIWRLLDAGVLSDQQVLLDYGIEVLEDLKNFC